MHLHTFFLVNKFYICTFAVQNNINMNSKTVNNLSNPARSTERNGISTNSYLLFCMLVGWFFKSFYHAEQQKETIIGEPE